VEEVIVYGDPSTLSSPVGGGGLGIGQLLGGQQGNRGLEQSTGQGFDRDVTQGDADKLREIVKKAQAALIAAGATPEEVAKIARTEQAMQSAEGLMNIIANPQSFLNNIRDRVRSVMDAGKNIVGTTTDLVTGQIPPTQFAEDAARAVANQAVIPTLRRGSRFFNKIASGVSKAKDVTGIDFGLDVDERIRDAGNLAEEVAGRIEPKASGGIMSLKDGGESDLRQIAKQRSAEVYGDPVMFERFAPSPLQQMDPSFRQSQFFMPVGQVPNFNMGIMGLPGQMYANYYPAGPVGQMNPINKQVMGMPGGAPMPPPPGSEPPVTAPPPSQDTGMTGEIWDKPYEEAIPRPKRADFADGPFQGKKGSEAFKRALEAWNRNKKIWDSFETGAERKKYYLSGLDNLNFADGGSTNFPRKNGQISGPGTERSDDIPAMLSDGEFVVNAKAVRGIGSLMSSGKPKSKAEQRRKGARAMYALQSAGEKASGLRG